MGSIAVCDTAREPQRSGSNHAQLGHERPICALPFLHPRCRERFD